MAPRVPGHVRERAVAAVETGLARHDVALAHGVSIRTLERWLAAARAGCSLEDRPRSGRPPVVSLAELPVLLARTSAHPDATLAETADWWTSQTGRRLGLSTLSRLLRRAGITRKKDLDRR
ncbi:MAG: hypothetical protein ACR2J8_05275 [Thermomicrobiales bacterium]